MKKLIPFDNSYEFSFIENKDDQYLSPISEYFLKLNDLSINLLISLKWLLWGYKFLIDLSNELYKLDNHYNIDILICKSIHTNLHNISNYEKHILIIDNKIIKNYDELYILINNFYSDSLFDPNTKIHLKLKISLKDYMIISNILFPAFIKFEK